MVEMMGMVWTLACNNNIICTSITVKTHVSLLTMIHLGVCTLMHHDPSIGVQIVSCQTEQGLNTVGKKILAVLVLLVASIELHNPSR